MSDAIVITGLEIEASVGVHKWECQIAQRLLVDIELLLDLRPAGNSDALRDTADYQTVAGLAVQVAQEKHHALIEHYSERLAHRILRQLPAIQQVALTISKPGAMAAARTVSVRICRTSGDYSS